ncbi:MAG: hypothetical protein DRI56_10745 [Chloroflexota bacterium]|nr:MAG: hypothetical protein DRI56_10745 [Chloroflexota bacterium]
MFAEFKHALRRSKGQIFGWGIALFLLVVLLVSLYDSIAAEQEAFQELLSVYPSEVSAFMGDMTSFGTPEGWVSIEFFSYMPVILGILGVTVGSGMLLNDEESGILDLVMAHPVNRTSLFMGRLLAFITTIVSILVIAWTGFIISMTWSTMDIGWGEMWLPLLSLLAVLLLFGALALFLSMILPSRRMASMITGLLLVSSFFITGLAELNDKLETAAKLSPLNYYQAQEAFNDFNGTWFAGLLASALIFTLLAWWRFERRDLRVAGEGGWRLGKLAEILKTKK